MNSKLFNENNDLKCKKCKNQFNEYYQPKKLPCENTICTTCEFTIQKEAINKRFECSICTQYHDIPDNGFVINNEIYCLLTAKPIQMIPSEECDQLELIINETKLLDNRMKNYKTECISELNEHCLEQKRLIQLATELKIQKLDEKEHSQSQIDQINQSNEKLIEIIDKYEQTCLEEFKNRTYDIPQRVFFDQNIFFMIDKFNELRLDIGMLRGLMDMYFKENQPNNEKFQKLIKRSEFIISRIHKELKKLKFLIFNNNKIEFIETNETELGYFEYDKCFKNILSKTSDDIIKIWDIESNECIRIFNQETEPLSCAKIAPGNIIIRGFRNGSVKIRNTTIDAHTDSVVDILILTQNKFITCSNDCTIKLFDFDTFECIRTFIGHESEVNAVDKISSDTIASCSHESIRIWNLNNGECLKVILDDRKYHHDLKVISETEMASVSCFRIKIWNINSGICLRTFGDNIDIWSIIHLSKEQIASCDEFGAIKIWNLNNGECLRTFNENKGELFLKKLTRNSIISCGLYSNSVQIWDTDTGNCLKVLQNEIDTIVDLF